MVVISKRKKFYSLSDELVEYLQRYGRESEIPVIYDDMFHFSEAYPYVDPKGNETLWHTVVYPAHEMAELRPKLAQIYTRLKIGGEKVATPDHLSVDRIDFGEFGNSKPFRVRITNQFNDNSDYFYVKRADASRVYGLEFEHIFSPNRINFLVRDSTLIEEHIAGVPGDVFIREYIGRDDLNEVRVAKEFVKFNERSFIRLLGDMRSVNYVIDATPDFEEVQYRVRPIDFDQQSYEGNIQVYLSQFFADNQPVVQLVTRKLNEETIRQYQREEQTIIARRRRIAQQRLDFLLHCMSMQELMLPEKFVELVNGLNEYHKTTVFNGCRSTGDLVRMHIDVVLSGL
ncbi:MAG: hypothetical protein AAGJ79_07485 [Verrucomicrobiota bacterium]